MLYLVKNYIIKKQNPDQSMMLFVTVTDLLDGYRKFYLSSKIEEYTCIGADSSFSISFKKANVII